MRARGDRAGTVRRAAAPAALAMIGIFVLASWPRSVSGVQAAGGRGPEAVSLLGKPLFRTPATGEALVKLESALRDAARKLEAAPEDPDTVILYSRALAALWRYHDAIDVYTRGISAHPDHAMLYRHRGHRYITVRAFDAAVADLKRAAQIDRDDFDIWYHLGLAHYLRGEFAQAETAYRRCLIAAKDEGSIIAVSNWLYITLRRSGRTEDAAKVLEGIREGMEPGENTAYYDLLLFYKGVKKEAELERAAAASDLDLATTGYGLACWHLYHGNTDKAFASFEKILAVPYWPAFGFIAAEAEVERAGRGAGR